MSDDQSGDVYILPKQTPLYLGLAFGLVAPLLLGLLAGTIYSGRGAGEGPAQSSVQVYPLPE